MKIQNMGALVAECPFFTGLPEADLTLLSGCAKNAIVAADELIARDGKPADSFYLVRAGRAVIEVAGPSRGPLRIQTVGPGEAIGWSWLVPPHRWTFDVRALEETHLIAFDARCLRGKCEANPALGYELLKRFMTVLAGRLTATRLQLLDLYGGGQAGALR